MSSDVARCNWQGQNIIYEGLNVLIVILYQTVNNQYGDTVGTIFERVILTFYDKKIPEKENVEKGACWNILVSG